MSDMEFTKSIDMRGKIISTYVLYETVQTMKQLNIGDVIEIVTDNYIAVENDVEIWIKNTGHNLLQKEKKDSYIRFYVEKGISLNKPGFAISIADKGLEELLSPLAMALAAALEGREVYIIFQGPAVKILETGFKGRLKGFSAIFSGFARNGMAKIGHIPPQEKVIQLKELGAHFYACPVSMEHFGVKQSDLIFDDITLGTYFTFLDALDSADVKIFLQ